MGTAWSVVKFMCWVIAQISGLISFIFIDVLCMGYSQLFIACDNVTEEQFQ